MVFCFFFFSRRRYTTRPSRSFVLSTHHRSLSLRSADADLKSTDFCSTTAARRRHCRVRTMMHTELLLLLLSYRNPTIHCSPRQSTDNVFPLTLSLDRTLFSTSVFFDLLCFDIVRLHIWMLYICISSISRSAFFLFIIFFFWRIHIRLKSRPIIRV